MEFQGEFAIRKTYPNALAEIDDNVAFG